MFSLFKKQDNDSERIEYLEKQVKELEDILDYKSLQPALFKRTQFTKEEHNILHSIFNKVINKIKTLSKESGQDRSFIFWVNYPERGYLILTSKGELQHNHRVIYSPNNCYDYDLNFLPRFLEEYFSGKMYENIQTYFERENNRDNEKLEKITSILANNI